MSASPRGVGGFGGCDGREGGGRCRGTCFRLEEPIEHRLGLLLISSLQAMRSQRQRLKLGRNRRLIGKANCAAGSPWCLLRDAGCFPATTCRHCACEALSGRQVVLTRVHLPLPATDFGRRRMPSPQYKYGPEMLRLACVSTPRAATMAQHENATKTGRLMSVLLSLTEQRQTAPRSISPPLRVGLNAKPVCDIASGGF